MTDAHETFVQVMDTTLRDGEQTPNVAYSPAEKLQLARILLEAVRVDRIEIASTGVSEGERRAAAQIMQWAEGAGFRDAVEVLGFCDGERSPEWIHGVGGHTLNLLVKGSELHCRQQLRQTPEQHRARAAETIEQARTRGLDVNVYLEDWSNGVQQSWDYVSDLVVMLGGLDVHRIYLPDTLGILSPDEAFAFVGKMVQTFPQQTFEFHAHNDYGLATANCLAAIRAGARGVHTSLNGLGERAGNAPLSQTVVAIHDFSRRKTRIDETQLLEASQFAETCSGKDIAPNTPVTGSDVFTQTAGIHADGDAKGKLYVSRLHPARFNRRHDYALGKLSGKASVDQNLARLSLQVTSEERQLLVKRITELGDKKHTVVPEDLPFIVADLLKRPEVIRYRIEDYEVSLSKQAPVRAKVTLADGGQRHSAEATGAGGYDAVMNALATIASEAGFALPRLVDYRVRIPPSGRTEALVEARISWLTEEGRAFSTLGVDSDQLAAAIVATEKMLNLLVFSGNG